jgi:hypothetical protein
VEGRVEAGEFATLGEREATVGGCTVKLSPVNYSIILAADMPAKGIY